MLVSANAGTVMEIVINMNMNQNLIFLELYGTAYKSIQSP